MIANTQEQVVIRSRSTGIDSIVNNIQTDTDFTKDVQDLSRISKHIYHPRSFNEVPKNIYDAFAERAELHRLAQIPGHFDMMKPDQIRNLPSDQKAIFEDNKCECGCKRVKGNPIPYFIPEKDLKFMGSAVCLFLLMIRIALALIIVQFIFYGIYMLVANPLANFQKIAECKQQRWPPCNPDNIHLPLTERKQKGLEMAGLWLGFLGCLLQIIFLRLTKSFGHDVDKKIDKDLKTPSDGALKFQNLPSKNNTQQEIEQFIIMNFESKLKDKYGAGKQVQEKLIDFKDKIKSIHIIYNLDEFRGLINQIKDQSIQVSTLLEKGTGKILTNVQQYKRQKQQLIKLLHKIHSFHNRFLQDRDFRRSFSSQCCIVQFYSEKTKTKYNRMFGMQRMGLFPRIFYEIRKRFCDGSTSQKYFKGNLILTQRAPQPDDIIWQNCQKDYKVWRILVVQIATLLLLCLGFGLMVLFEYIQKRVIEKGQSQSLVTLLGTVIPVTQSLMNYFISWTIAFLMDIENNHSCTDEIISMYKRALVGSVLNSIFFPIFSIYIVNGTLFGRQGLAVKMLNFSITNCILSAFFTLFDLTYLLKRFALSIHCIRNRIMKYWLFSKVKNPESMQCIVTVNKFYQNGPINMTGCYTYVNLVLMHSAFYCTIQPMILLVACISVSLAYFINKYLLLRRYSSTKKLHRLVFDHANVSISYTPLMFAIGSLLTVLVTGGKNQPLLIIPSAIGILLSLINILNPKELFDHYGDKMYGFMKRGSKRLQERMESMRIQSFERDLEYYEVSTLSTLFGYKKIIHGQDITEEIQKKVDNFVRNFGPFPKQYDYPSMSQSQPPQQVVSDNIIELNIGNSQL